MHIIKQFVYNGEHENLCVYTYWLAYKYNNFVETPKPVSYLSGYGHQDGDWMHKGNNRRKKISHCL